MFWHERCIGRASWQEVHPVQNLALNARPIGICCLALQETIEKTDSTGKILPEMILSKLPALASCFDLPSHCIPLACSKCFT